MPELTTTTPAEAFRAEASDLMVRTANMSLHSLLDEFLSLTLVMDQNCTKGDDDYRAKLNETGELASRKRRLVVGAARARFGIGFEVFDRPSASHDSDF